MKTKAFLILLASAFCASLQAAILDDPVNVRVAFQGKITANGSSQYVGLGIVTEQTNSSLTATAFNVPSAQVLATMTVGHGCPVMSS
jgi:predicted transcriptional regulator with HTH domain